MKNTNESSKTHFMIIRLSSDQSQFKIQDLNTGETRYFDEELLEHELTFRDIFILAEAAY